MHIEKFIRNKRGDVVSYIIVFAALVLIGIYVFSNIKGTAKESTEVSACGIDSTLEMETQENCDIKIEKLQIKNDAKGSSGAKIYSSCADIQENGGGSKSGSYQIKTPMGDVKRVTCDMTTNGGGWTLISEEEFVASTTPPVGSGLIAKEAFSTPNYTGDAPSGWYTMFAGVSNGKTQAKTIITDTGGIRYTEVNVEIQATFSWSVDGFSNTHGNPPNRMSIDGQYVDGISVTAGGQGSRTHIHTFSPSTLGASDERRTFIGNDFTVGSTINTKVKKTIPATTAIIETRIMLDQTWQDESIGIQKLKIWVK